MVEMIMVVGIFLFTFVGVMLGVQLFGLRIYTLEATKLVATQSARMALNAMRDNIREAKNVYVGSCSAIKTNSFSLLAVTNIQQGNALIVYPTTNASAFTVYYLDTSSSVYVLNQFNVTNNQIVYTNQLAQYLTNLVVFDAENYKGVTATNYTSLDNREVIRVTLQFSQWEYPIAFVGGHDFNAFDFYQLRTKVFRRAWN
jgi:hypothetical protein